MLWIKCKLLLFVVFFFFVSDVTARHFDQPDAAQACFWYGLRQGRGKEGTSSRRKKHIKVLISA